MGARELRLDGDYLGFLQETTADHLADATLLADRWRRDGYLLLRGVLDRDLVRGAGRLILERLRTRAARRRGPGAPGATGAASPSFAPRADDLTRDPATSRLLLAIAAAPALAPLLDALIGRAAPPATVTPWVAGHGHHVPPHVDVPGCDGARCCAAWTPLDDVTWRLGPLAVLERSHECAALHADCAAPAAPTPDVDGPVPGGDPRRADPVQIVDRFGGRWLSAEFQAGDVLLLRGDVLHASLTNTTPQLRLTAVARYAAREAAAPATRRPHRSGTRNLRAASADSWGAARPQRPSPTPP